MAQARKPKAPKAPKETKATVAEEVQPVKEQPVRQGGYVHIDVFLDTARALFKLHPYEVAGFKAYMIGTVGSTYQRTDKDFIPYLEQYLGKEVK